MWSKHKAVFDLQQVVAMAGLPPIMEYALHFSRIGGAADLAAGASPEELRAGAEGR